MRIYRGDRAIVWKSSKYPQGRLVAIPFRLGKMSLRNPRSFTTSRKVAEEFARAAVRPGLESYIPVIIVADAPKVRKTAFWDFEREVAPIGPFVVKAIEALDEGTEEEDIKR